MKYLALQLATLLSLWLPIIAHGAEKARLRIVLENVPIGPAIIIQAHMVLGANISHSDAPLPKRFEYRFEKNRGSGSIEYLTEPFQLEESVKSLIIYGRIVTESGAPLRYIPAKLLKIENRQNLNQLRLSIVPQKTFDEAFKASYPLEFMSDTGFITDDTLQPTLRTLRNLIDYSGEIGAKASPEVWDRLHSFFKVNRGYFKRGSSKELSAILQYLRTYTAASRAPNAAKFYAEFLNELVSGFTGREVFDGQDLTDYLHGQLMEVYDSKLEDSFDQTNISLDRFHRIRKFEQCLILSEKILKKIDLRLLQKALAQHPKTMFGVMVETTRCGEGLVQEKLGTQVGSLSLSEVGAQQLARSEVGKAAIREFLRVSQLMSAEGVINLNTNSGDAGEVVKFHFAYSKAMAVN